MKLGFFTMPIHPLHRPLSETLQEDREFCLIAEKLGFCEGYFGEHVTDGAETITSSLIFIAWLLNETKTIKLGSGTINLPNQHPARVAGEVAMLDHMARGRYLMGISPGGLLSDAEVFGNLDKNRTEMFVEAIDHILAIWSGEPPYNLQGKYWNITTERTYIPALGQGAMHKPYQTPHPPIVITAVAPFSKGVTEAAQRGWDPISANFLLPCWVKTHWPRYVEGCEKGGRPADPANWRVAKSIFVADDLATAKRYATEPGSPYYAYYNSLATKLVSNGRANLFKRDPNAPDSSVTVDSVLSDLVIWGTPDKVADELAAFQDEIGEFGTLLYAGHDWADKQLAIRSLELMAEKVMPAVNAGRHSAAAE
ncbi:LLM class flavin-dependent oxidoreductase [Ancylobacter polymorphus]|uniref:LLM class flavin-dependent oxidoreductase n=1 Tax=Ancylobacter polymorphus TaxID=223390 RepID=A0A9E6ZYS2_9HYPH|nr:LLM class flavin-dependent oxidoreductase [Ancylobacter polymorphus]UOK72672.1 LLM class flavin-dependent oxidoreductase [Ancylobacter polymorphus]